MLSGGVVSLGCGVCCGLCECKVWVLVLCLVCFVSYFLVMEVFVLILLFNFDVDVCVLLFVVLLEGGMFDWVLRVCCSICSFVIVLLLLVMLFVLLWVGFGVNCFVIGGCIVLLVYGW